ncbi:MAG: EamA family transporter [Bacteroidales bacterium]|nr:EamA family transporter [Bacteroidales bacterium]
MVWSLLAVASAFLLGIYDILKKSSLRGNYVFPVLFISCVTGALLFLPPIVLSSAGTFSPDSLLYVPDISSQGHLLVFFKSLLVASSWILAYFAIKHLPLTIASPIRASAPLWTLLGAVLLFGEKMNGLQWAGILTTLLFYYLFSLAGKKEGIDFRKNRWILYMVLATILGSISALYDKFLVLRLGRMAVQAWYSVYLVPVMLVMLIISWQSGRSSFLPYRWTWTIPLIGITLSVADFLYFYSLSLPGALIGVVSTLRRGSVLVSFLGGAHFFKDKNIKVKFLILAGILAGILIIVAGSR